MNPRVVRLNGIVLRALIATTGACCAFAGMTTPARGQCTWEEIARVGASDAAELDTFGSAVAMSGDTALVGAPGNDDVDSASGSAYVFVRTAGAWTEQAKLVASDAAAMDAFGTSVAIDGDTAVVGAISDDDGGSASGSAYVFVRAAGVWTQQGKLTASDAAADDAFGATVAVSGDTILIGAWGDDEPLAFQVGSAYVFVRTAGVWTQQAKLTASDAVGQEYFGKSVALSGNTALIGAFGDDHAGGNGAGSAYVFVRNGAAWAQQAKLTASDAAASDQFGISVAVSGDTAVIGAVLDDHAGGVDAGSAYVFTRAGAVWTQRAKLTSSDTAAGDELGGSVAVTDGKVVVGTNLDDHAGGTDAGAAYVFVKPGTGWITMTETAKLIATDAAATDDFGISVAVTGNTALIGAGLDDTVGGTDFGSVYFHECTVPGCPVPITASDAAAGDWFGNVAFDGETIVVGARRNDNATGVDAGAAYVYVKTGPPGSEAWTEQAKLVGTNVNGGYAGSESGEAVAISGDTAIVGSWLWPLQQGIGAVYIFVRSGPPGSEVWTQTGFHSNTAFFGAFQYVGVSVALEGDTALVGSLAAPGLNIGGTAIFLMRSGPPGAEIWSPQNVYSSDGVPGDQFGISVAVSASQDWAVVGAWLDDNAGGTDAGSAYVFTRSGPNPEAPWVQQAKLTAPDGAAFDQFGRPVAIDGDTIVVGARWDDHADGTDAGAAYVFTRSGAVWSQQAKLIASDASPGDEFGLVASISGNTIVVGSYSDDHPIGIDAGSAYVFTRSGTVWTEQYKLASPDAATGDVFGGSVALSGETVVVGVLFDDHAGGADAGSAYVFDLGCEAVCCAGDFDANNAVTVEDMSGFVTALLAGGACPAAPACCSGDLNADALVDGHDVSGFVAKLLSGGSCQ